MVKSILLLSLLIVLCGQLKGQLIRADPEGLFQERLSSYPGTEFFGDVIPMELSQRYDKLTISEESARSYFLKYGGMYNRSKIAIEHDRKSILIYTYLRRDNPCGDEHPQSVGFISHYSISEDDNYYQLASTMLVYVNSYYLCEPSLIFEIKNGCIIVYGCRISIEESLQPGDSEEFMYYEEEKQYCFP